MVGAVCPKFPTDPYRELGQKIKKLNSLLNRLPPYQCDKASHHLKVQSYLLLAHAAFESYIEKLSELMLDYSFNKYISDVKLGNVGVSLPIAALIASEVALQMEDGNNRKKITSSVAKRITDFVSIAQKNHRDVIKGNNGIKRKDVINLLAPLGLDPESVDTITLNDIDAFGTKRGAVAHDLQMKTLETRSSVTKTVKVIYKGLSQFDKAAVNILKTC